MESVEFKGDHGDLERFALASNHPVR